MRDLNNNYEFYKSVLRRLLAEQVLTTKSRILVVCGGEEDCKVLHSLGFENVTISNLSIPSDATAEKNPYAPYEVSHQDAENLSYPDGHFEFVLVHSGLHHLRCPQRGIGEMYRVASSGILGVEPCRNLITSLAVHVGIGQEYETAAVFYNDYTRGGVADSLIPNYVCRFSRGDIVRTVQTFAPIARHRFRFWYAARFPERLERMENRVLGAVARACKPVFLCFGKILPFLANSIAFYVPKPDLPRDLFPWLSLSNGTLVPNREYLDKVYRPHS